jgi:universal stress protein A
MTKAFRKILVPVDFSAHSEQAVRMAASIARRYEALLDIIHVYEPLSYPLPEGYVMFTQQQLETMFAEFDRLLRLAKETAEAAGASQVETHVRQGLAVSAICELAREGAYDLIVMGTRGRTGLGHLLLGSVAESVLRAAPCPVLTVKAVPEKADQTASAIPAGARRT